MKERLDILVVQGGLAPSREKARALIMAGQVLVDGEREDKPGATFESTCEITLKKGANPFPYVSRGGAKLAKALDVFSINLAGRDCMDVGSSTGGFTDCMLQRLAARVAAVDVGYGQLDWSLREDPRVTVLEKTNIRYLTREELGFRPSFVSVDVSFISLSKVFPRILELMEETGEIVALIKPQFEAGREKVGKKGVVRDPATHREVIKAVIEAAASLGLKPAGLDYSPIKGPQGNIEYLLFLGKGTDERNWPGHTGEAATEKPTQTEERTAGEALTAGGLWRSRIEETVAAAHAELD